MPARYLLLALIVLVFPLLGDTCVPAPPPTHTVTLVAPLADVATFDFSVDFDLTGDFDTDTIEVSINFVSIKADLTGGPTSFSVPVGPGTPLQETGNILLVSAEPTSTPGSAIVRGTVFDYVPPCKAEAFEITDAGDLPPAAPLAHGRVGDYMLRNCGSEFILDRPPERDLYSTGQYAGNIIDARLAGSTVPDNFLEVAPMANVETVFNHQTAEIVNDGKDGAAAAIRMCGPDDNLDFVNPSSQVTDGGIPYSLDNEIDHDIEGCTTYSLEAGTKTYLRLDTRVVSSEVAALPLAVGDWMNGGGALEQWASPGPGIGQALFSHPTISSFVELDALSFFGFEEALGTDYQYTTIPVTGLETAKSNFFSVSGVTILLHNAEIVASLFGTPPPFVVPALGENTYSRFFGVGDGDGNNAIELAAEVKGRTTGDISGCVSLGGSPVEGAKVTIGTDDGGGAIAIIAASFVTDPGACPNYAGSLPEGSYIGGAGLAGAPYEGGGSTPTLKAITIADGSPETADFPLPATGTITVTVKDEAASPLPARVTVAGFDPSPEPIIPGDSFLGFSGDDLGLFTDARDVHPYGVTSVQYTGADGSVTFEIEPGSYEFVASRGTEYSADSEPVVVAAGANATVELEIARVVDTAGFISSDFHIHGIRSADSRVSDARRVNQFAAEHIENPIMTDHHVHTDLIPEITAAGLGAFLTSTVGEEITTFDYGHFNGFPFLIDTSVPSGGSTDWARAEIAGTDFALAPHFHLSRTPAEIQALATTNALNPQAIDGVTTIQINHISSHFSPLKIDWTGVTPVDSLTDAERIERRLPDTTAEANLFAEFEALELWNGSTRGAQSEFLDGRIGIWFHHLNRGMLATSIADTDTHTFENLRTAGARTWTASPTDSPSLIDGDDVAASVDAGLAVGGQGLYVQAELITSAGTADLTLAGSNIVGDDDGDVMVRVSVQSPEWADWDTIEVYANSTPVATGTNGDPPVDVLFSAGTPVATRSEGDCEPSTTGDGDFDITETTVVTIGGVDQKVREATVDIPYSAGATDTWFVVVVKGLDAVETPPDSGTFVGCAPMFPVYPSNLDAASNTTLGDLLDGNKGQGGVMALGYTNPLYLDVDGTAGFDPPIQ